MDKVNSGISRRSFLWMVGMAGGASAVYETMVAMGLLQGSEAWAGPPRFKAAQGNGQSVVILGAGIGGLTAAYELTRAGYRCTILEAQNRPGGRSLTIRRGEKIVEQSERHGRTEQTCQFDEGLYLNMGPGRLPYHHRRVLHYCHELGVPLEIYVMTSTANLIQTPQGFAGRALKRRQLDADSRGYIAELLTKAIDQQCLDQTLDESDRDKMRELLKVFGDLNDSGRYSGSTRAGCAQPPTVHQPCASPQPLELNELLDSEFWRQHFYQPDDFEWQPTLFQPVGGMDQIVSHFVRALTTMYNGASPILLQHEITRIEVAEKGVIVHYHDRANDQPGRMSADYCLSNIPLPILNRIKANFSPDFQDAVAHARFAPTCKVGWQANERFWENNQNQIYGGISYIDQIMTQMWYPSNDYFTRNGTLTGAYNYDEAAVAMGEMSLDQRLRSAREGAIRLHQEFRDERIVPTKLGLSIAWQNVPFQGGGWSDWTDTPADRRAYARLLAPDRRFHVLGDQVSTLPGWQEGAMMSAEHVVEQLGGFRPLSVPQIERAPHTQRLVRGRFR
ncbi:MAG: flavin monoamine oxidase family protein [Wenzhouxiangellaceae bacterium]